MEAGPQTSANPPKATTIHRFKALAGCCLRVRLLEPEADDDWRDDGPADVQRG